MNTYRNDLLIEAERGLRRERLRSESAAAFAVCAFVIFVFLAAQAVGQIIWAAA